MERNRLVDEIVKFCFENRLFSNYAGTSVIKRSIEDQLNNCEFVENMINTMILKTKNRKNIDVEKLKELILELEKIRLDMEYDD